MAYQRMHGGNVISAGRFRMHATDCTQRMLTSGNLEIYVRHGHLEWPLGRVVPYAPEHADYPRVKAGTLSQSKVWNDVQKAAGQPGIVLTAWNKPIGTLIVLPDDAQPKQVEESSHQQKLRKALQALLAEELAHASTTPDEAATRLAALLVSRYSMQPRKPVPENATRPVFAGMSAEKKQELRAKALAEEIRRNEARERWMEGNPFEDDTRVEDEGWEDGATKIETEDRWA